MDILCREKEINNKPFSHASKKSFSSSVVSSFTSLTSFKARNLSGEEASVPWYRAAITKESECGQALMCIPLETGDHYTRKALQRGWHQRNPVVVLSQRSGGLNVVGRLNQCHSVLLSPPHLRCFRLRASAPCKINPLSPFCRTKWIQYFESVDMRGDGSLTKRHGRLPRRLHMHHLLASQDPGDRFGPDAADGALTAHVSSSTCSFISQAQSLRASWLCNRAIRCSFAQTQIYSVWSSYCKGTFLKILAEMMKIRFYWHVWSFAEQFSAYFIVNTVKH